MPIGKIQVRQQLHPQVVIRCFMFRWSRNDNGSERCLHCSPTTIRGTLSNSGYRYRQKPVWLQVMRASNEYAIRTIHVEQQVPVGKACHMIDHVLQMAKLDS